MKKILVILLVLVIVGCKNLDESNEKGLVRITGNAIAFAKPNIETPTSDDREQYRRFFKILEESLLAESKNFEEYYNADYGIKIKYPSNWKIIEDSGNTIVEFVSLLESNADMFLENLNIMVQDLSEQPITLDEYKELSLQQIKLLFGESDVIELSQISIAGYTAHRLVHTGKYGQFNLKWLQIYTIKDNKAYLITYTAEENKYNKFLETIQQMIGSFDII